MKSKNFIITEKNVDRYVEEIAKWIKNKIKTTKRKGVVIGMSGGIDCSVVARLCQMADIPVHLILMPYGGDMTNTSSYTHAMELIDKFNISYSIKDIKPAIDALADFELLQNDHHKLALANIRPRVRMTYLYEYAQYNEFAVVGTSNLAERTIGYFTKWGDGVSDLNPLGMLTKGEVRILAKYLGVPESIINKAPSADLWPGQTDEREIGMNYDEIDKFILFGTSGNKETDEKIRKRIKYSNHKHKSIPIYTKLISES